MQNLVNWSDNCDGDCCHVELVSSIANHMGKLAETGTGKTGFDLQEKFGDELRANSRVS